MKNLLKKKSRIKVLLERSELIQFILCLLAMVLLCILNYLAAKWECSLAIPDTNSGLFYSLLLITFMAGNIVGLFLLLCILLVLKYAVVSTITEWIRQFRAFNNYCYIPLTEDEVRGFSFASAREYFGHISQMLYYGGKDDEEKSTKYVQLKNADLNKMLAICLKVFPDNGTIFSLRYRDCKNICDDSEAFMQFLDFYHVSYESDEKYAPSANINKNGIVSLSVLNKDGRGIIWDGESFLLQHFSKDVVYRFGIETVSLHAFAELLSLDPSQSFISYHTLKCYGEEVAHLLKEKEIPTTFTLSRDDIDLMLREYSDFFTETTINGEKGILLSDQKNYDDMMDLLVQLCQYMPNLFLTAFSDKQAVRLLSNE